MNISPNNGNDMSDMLDIARYIINKYPLGCHDIVCNDCVLHNAPEDSIEYMLCDLMATRELRTC